MPKNSPAKNIFSVFLVPGGGFILISLALFFDYFFQNLTARFIGLFASPNVFLEYKWYPPLMHGLSALVICFVSWSVLKSKLGTLAKATYLTVPAAVVLATAGIFLYRWPAIAYSVGGLLTVGTLIYFYKTKQSWQYYYAVILVATALAIMGILGVEI